MCDCLKKLKEINNEIKDEIERMRKAGENVDFISYHLSAFQSDLMSKGFDLTEKGFHPRPFSSYDHIKDLNDPLLKNVATEEVK